jgi:3-dehydroquinate synthase
VTLPLRITLTGYSGSGKSSVGRLVAERLGWEFADSDDFFPERTGKTIAQLFAEDGEAAFRVHETAILRSLLAEERIVVASGGGAVLTEDSRRAMAEAGLVICLEATPTTILERVKQPDAPVRPLIAWGYPLSQIERFKAQRASLYSLADHTLHTDTLTPEEAADEIVRFYRQHGERVFARPGRIDALTKAPPNAPAILDAANATSFIRAASGEYPAYVAWGALERLGEYTKRATGSRRAFLVSDSQVLSIWGETALSSLREAGLETEPFSLPPGDASKSLENVGKAYDWLAAKRAERRDAVVALGGGMVGDFAGFVAGTYLRGMPVVQAPTSLLAMVDASIGGKTAVNHAGAKNIVGIFYQPRAVVADVATLKTLPRRALVEGMAEVIKHAFIRDPDLLTLLEERLDDLLALDHGLTTEVIARNVQIKGAVVSEDERETGGVREVLNYGHTLGHAFEAAGDYESLLHGEAVSAGMMAAAEIGRRVGITPASVVERQLRLLERSGLPLKPPPGLDRERIRTALSLDKKVVAGGQRWVLLEEIGKPIVRDNVPASVVEAVLDDFLAG